MDDLDMLTPDDGTINDEPLDQDDFIPDDNELDPEPELLVGKFKDVDSLAKSYKELEKLSTQTRQEKAAQDKRIAELEATLASANRQPQQTTESQPSEAEQIEALARELQDNEGFSYEYAKSTAEDRITIRRLQNQLLQLGDNVTKQISNVAGDTVFDRAMDSFVIPEGIDKSEIKEYLKTEGITTEQFINSPVEAQKKFIRFATGDLLLTKLENGSLGKGKKSPPPQDAPNTGGAKVKGTTGLSESAAHVKAMFPEFTPEQAERVAKEWKESKQ